MLFFTQIDNEEHHTNYINIKPEDVWNQPDQDFLKLGGCLYLDKKVKIENKFPAFHSIARDIGYVIQLGDSWHSSKGAHYPGFV